MKFEFIRMPDSTGFGDYTEAGQVIPVRLGERIGNYTLNMFLNDHPPIAAGRELWGFPKKLAGPTLRVETDTLVGTLDYGPIRVATGTMGYKHREADADLTLGELKAPNFLLKIIPHVDGSPRICELVEYHLEDIRLKGVWGGPGALSLHAHALAPVAELPVRSGVDRSPHRGRDPWAWESSSRLSRIRLGRECCRTARAIVRLVEDMWMSWWRDGSNISRRMARCPAWGRLIQLRDGREWDAFVYADFEGSQNFERISGVKIFELCQQAAMDRIRTLPAPDKTDYECAYMCRFEPAYGANVCKEPKK